LGSAGLIAVPPAGAAGAGDSSDWQPVTKESASTRLETIMLALIPDVIVTDALLEKHANKKGHLKPALPTGTSDWFYVVKTERETPLTNSVSVTDYR
jgi:hypothetical protein